jgi:hypothetical protein
VPQNEWGLSGGEPADTKHTGLLVRCFSHSDFSGVCRCPADGTGGAPPHEFPFDLLGGLCSFDLSGAPAAPRLRLRCCLFFPPPRI